MFRFIYFLIVISFPLGLFSQQEKQISFNQLSVKDGLSQNSVVHIAQDKIGYLWFATQDGLNKYNGINFEYYPLLFDDITKENYSKLGKIFVTANNEIYVISTNGMLQKLDKEKKVFKKINHFKNVCSIYQTKDSSIWIGTSGNGFYKVTKKDTIQITKNKNGLKSNYAITNFKNKVVVASSNSLFLIAHNQTNKYSKINKPNTNFSSFANYKDSLFVGSFGKGLFYTTNLRKLMPFNGFNKTNSLPNNLNILSLLKDNQKRLWIGTYGKGVYLIDFSTKTIKHFYTQNRNPKAIHYNDILSIYQDQTGTIWFGTDGAGLSYYEENLSKFNVLTNYQTPVNIDIDVIRAIAINNNNKIILGSSGNGLTIYNPKKNTFKTFNANGNNTILSNRIMSLLVDNEQLWIGYQDKGLSILKNNKFTHFSKNSKPSLNINTIWCILKDSKKRIWLGTRDNGLIQFDTKKGVIKKYVFNKNNNKSISENNIRSISESKDGNLWIGTENAGLNKFFISQEIFKRYVNPKTKNIKSLQQVDSVLWIGTNGNGLQALDLNTEKLHSYTIKNGLSNNIIYGILEDENKDLWLSSNRGISQFNFKNFNTNPKIINYDNQDGLQGLEFNTGAYFKDKKGTLYFGGLKGINWFLPSKITKNKTIPKTVIYKLELFDKEISLKNNALFKNYQNTFTFSFAALHFAQPLKNKYSYLLENQDIEWSSSSNKNFAHYTNLNPGNYTFKVISSNYDSVWNTTPTSFNFTIKPIWYLTFWAKIAYIILAFLLLLLIYRYLKWRWKMELKLKLEQQETERLQKLNKLKTKLYTNISHEFRTPLTLISGPIQQLIKDANLSTENQKYVSIIEQSSNRMLRLINQMLDLSLLEEGKVSLKVTQNNLHKQLQQSIDAFTLLANEKGIVIKTNLVKLKETWFDKDILEKVVSNLLSNAIKYAPKNSSIQFETKQENKNLILIVANKSKKIKTYSLSKLFDRFYQNDANSIGIGIGLSLIKELITLSRGSISVSKKDKKTIVFRVRLPILKNAYAKSELATVLPILKTKTKILPKNKSLKKEEKPVLLIVEDNVVLKNFIANLFLDTYKIITAKNGLIGIKKAIKNIPNIIISDIMMPKKDGLQLTNTLKNDVRTSHIPIVLLTAKTGDKNKLKGLKLKADDYITKPFNNDILKQKITNLIDAQKKAQKKYSQNLSLQSKDISVNSVDEKLLIQIQKIIDNKLTDASYSATQFAQDLDLSRMQLHRKLKAITGLSTSIFIRNQRLKTASKLLKNSDLTVNEIAYAVGFSSPSYFITCFKDVYGVTPNAFKL